MSEDNRCTNCDTTARACEHRMIDCCCECQHEDN